VLFPNTRSISAGAFLARVSCVQDGYSSLSLLSLLLVFSECLHLKISQLSPHFFWG